ncbi:MAG: glycosyltransferase [Butyricicoccus sp.]|nr:glycosyltransferase [Butyricicoccus sp.]
MQISFLFSVIVPVYNAQDYLPRCIDSLVMQKLDRHAWELILVDDGSADRSGEICDAYAAEYPQIQVIHKQNGGHTSARNAGLTAAQGEYVLFVDSDDWVNEDMLASCADEIEAQHPDVVLFGHWRETEQKSAEVQPEFPPGSYGLEELQREIFPHVMMDEAGHFFPRALWGKAFRRELVSRYQLRIPQQLRTGEDMCCVICTVLAAQRISVLPQCLYHYRILPASISRRGDAEACTRCSCLLHFLEQEIKEHSPALREQLLRLTVQQMYSSAVRLLGAELSWKEKQKRFAALYQLPLCREAVGHARFSRGARTLRLKQLLLRYRWLAGISFFCRWGANRKGTSGL